MKLHVAAVSIILYFFSGMQAMAQTRRALLIGINTYQPEGTRRSILPAAPTAAASWAPSITLRAR